ncbi:MAG: hypothetical protein PHP35_00925 [Candidatus Colwellbacteria bacterium]|nr:hypothetical protein [Candidatus Colwellbacteria bacterium]
MIGIKELLRLVAEEKLVEGLCDRELTEPEGAGFDLRLAEVFDLVGEGFLGVKNRQTPDTVSVAKYDPEKVKNDVDDFFVFRPGEYHLVKTIEKVNLPLDLLGLLFIRTTLFRSGLVLLVSSISPGYKGELTFGICNLGKENVNVSLGARIVNITFQEVIGGGTGYRGQWQGGRVSTQGEKEEQV